MFDFLFPWLPLIIKISTSLILKMSFFMATFRKRCLWDQPSGFVTQGEIGKVCRLRKSFNGLKQSLCALFGKFSQAVEKLGM